MSEVANHLVLRILATSYASHDEGLDTLQPLAASVIRAIYGPPYTVVCYGSRLYVTDNNRAGLMQELAAFIDSETIEEVDE